MSSDRSKNAINVQTWLKYGQARFGDNNASGEESVLPENVIISVKQAHWSELSSKRINDVDNSGKSTAITSAWEPFSERLTTSAIIERIPSKWPRPVWHRPWKNYRVISGHLGWVRSVAFDPSNKCFCTGSADRTIKIWDVASGRLKLTLTGHIEQIRGLAVSSKHTYMFSAGDDKQVKCWDLGQNKKLLNCCIGYLVLLSGVYYLALHPTIDILLTGGRDSVCRV
ncbi:protein pleiotropic regulator PRL2-like [Hibiscus syriacus]|uniref:protein pleiotropic regulator PRL2-like n=1 Tax=Hibiscus syriacus TaxID=106335 RepID=UPI001922C9E3|nr:protein pleiotropic regulator PRL2-like [Hibiscus syriacus]